MVRKNHEVATMTCDAKATKLQLTLQPNIRFRMSIDASFLQTPRETGTGWRKPSCTAGRLFSAAILPDMVRALLHAGRQCRLGQMESLKGLFETFPLLHGKSPKRFRQLGSAGE